MTPVEEIQALTDAIDQLETELQRALPDDKRISISDTLIVLRAMRAVIKAEAAPTDSTPTEPN